MRSSLALLSGLLLASAGRADESIRLVIDPGAHTGPVTQVLFTRDGKRLISTSTDRTARVHDVATGKTLRVIHLPQAATGEGGLHAAALSPDDRLLALGGDGYRPDRLGWIYLFELGAGRLVRILRGGNSPVRALAFSPGGKWLASASDSGAIQVWRPEKGEVKRELSVPFRSWGYRLLAFSPDGETLATAGSEGPTTLLWNVTQRGPVSQLPPLARPEALLLPAAGLRPPGASGLGQLPWAALRLAGRPWLPPVSAVCWAPDGAAMATGDSEGMIRLWGVHGQPLRHFALGPGPIQSLHYTPNGRTLLAAFWKNATACWAVFDLASGRWSTFVEKPPFSTSSAALSADGALLATGSSLGEIHLWGTATRTSERTLPTRRRAPLGDVGWSEDGATLGWGDGNGLTTFLSLRELRLTPRPQGAFTESRPAWRRTTIQGGRRSVRLVEKDASALVVSDERGNRTIRVPPGVGGIQHFCLVGDFVAAATYWYLYVFDCRGQSIYSRHLEGHVGPTLALAPSPDGRFLVAGVEDRILKVWDVANSRRSEPVLTLFAGGDDGVAWTDGGYYAAWGKGDGMVRWSAEKSPQTPGRVLEGAAAGRLDRRLRRPDFVRAVFQEGRLPLTQRETNAWILEDLEQAAPSDRRHYRYASFAHLLAGAAPGYDLQTHREALPILLNSLSWAPHLHRPSAIDPARSVFRIDLRALGWDARLWRRLLENYPYGFRGRDDPSAERLARACGTPLPCVRGDWLLAAASRPPLYHDLLGLPNTEKQLEERLGIDAAANIRKGHVVRCGFTNSEVSRNNRLLERHQSRYGFYWRSYDFGGGTGRQHLLSHPLGPAAGPSSFQHDGGEAVFQLPNGLQAYLLSKALGQRIDTAPVHIVFDNREVGPVVNGVSCMRCHDQGMMPTSFAKADEVRPHVMRNPAAFTDEERDTVRALYRPAAEFNAFLREDADRFAKALRELGGPPYALALGRAATSYKARLDVHLAAAELGVTTAALVKGLGQSRLLAEELGPLLAPGGQVTRAVFEEEFPEAVRELRLGDPQRLRPLAATAPTPVASEQPAPRQAHQSSEEPASGLGRCLALLAVPALGLGGLAWLVWRRKALRGRRLVGIGVGLVLAGGAATVVWAWEKPGGEGKGERSAGVSATGGDERLLRARGALERGDLNEAVDELAESFRQAPNSRDGLLLRGQVRLALRDLDGALADLERVLALDPANAAALRDRGRVLHGKGDAVAALADLDRALVRAPADGLALAARAGVWLDRGRLTRAEADARAAVRVPHPPAEANENLGRVLLQRGRREEARAALDEALRREPGRASALYYRALCWEALDEAAYRAEELDALLTRTPRHAADYYWRGLAWSRKGEHDRALACLTQAVWLQTGWADPHVSRARVYRAKGDLRESLADYSAALSLAPARAIELRHKRADTHKRRNDRKAALADLDSALAVPARDAQDHADRAYALIERRGLVGPTSRDLPAALAECDRALALAPGFAPALVERGYTWKELGELARARSDLEQALERTPLNSSALHYLAVLQRDAKQTAQALETVNEALQSEDADAGLFSLRAGLLFTKGERAAALADRHRALRIEPGSASLYASRGQLLNRLGRSHEALADYEEACRLAPGNTWHHFSRGVCLLALDRPGSARAAFSEAVRLEPRNDVAYRELAQAHRLLGQAGKAAEALRRGEELRLTKARLRAAAAALVHTGPAQAGGSLQAAFFLAAGRETGTLPAAAVMDLAPPARPHRPGALSHVRRAAHYRRQGNSGAAHNNLDEAGRLDPGCAEVWVLRGQLAADAGRRIDALGHFDKATQLSPNLDEAWRLRGLVQVEMGRYTDGITSLNRAVALAPQPSMVFAKRGYAHQMTKEFPKAVADFENEARLLEAEARSPGLLAGLAGLRIGQPPLAALSAAAAARPSTDLHLAWFNRGVNHQSLGKPDRAIGDYTTSIQSYPGYVEAYLNRGELLLKKGSPLQAVADASKAIALRQSYDLRGYQLRATAYRRAGLTAQAEADEKTVAALTPKPFRITPGPLMGPAPPRNPR
jgi:tetratricopeptide (TPR) repeat protein/WD40 repeat protein